MYAQYEPETDSILLWAFTGKTENIIDPEDGDWGRWSMREKIVGRRKRESEWIKTLTSIWEAV